MKQLSINNQILTEDAKWTFLSADVSSGDATLTVESIIGFAVNQVLLVGDLGNEKTEIIKTHASTAPTGSTITLASNLVFNHPIGTKIYIIPFNQIEISHADTEIGSKTVLATIDIQGDQKETVYTDTAESAGYYFVRFKNDIDTTYSDYSDPIAYAGFGRNSVNYIINYALKRNKTGFTDNVNHQFCIDEINACLKYIRGKLKKWHRLQEFDYKLGQTARGEWRFAVPATMWGYSNKSILDIYLEGEKPLVYKDEREFNEELEGVVYDTLSAGASAGDTSITLTNSYGFGDSGTVMIRGQEITFTANDTTTGVLSGIPASGTGAITATLASGSFVWKGSYEESQPTIYTVKEGYIYTWPLVDSNHDGINVMIDFWKEAPSVDSDADTLDIMRFDMVKYWLTASIRFQLKNDGIRDLNDGDYIMFETMLNDALKIEARSHAQKYPWKPKLNKISF